MSYHTDRKHLDLIYRKPMKHDLFHHIRMQQEDALSPSPLPKEKRTKSNMKWYLLGSAVCLLAGTGIIYADDQADNESAHKQAQPALSSADAKQTPPASQLTYPTSGSKINRPISNRQQSQNDSKEPISNQQQSRKDNKERMFISYKDQQTNSTHSKSENRSNSAKPVNPTPSSDSRAEQDVTKETTNTIPARDSDPTYSQGDRAFDKGKSYEATSPGQNNPPDTKTEMDTNTEIVLETPLIEIDLSIK